MRTGTPAGPWPRIARGSPCFALAILLSTAYASAQAQPSAPVVFDGGVVNAASFLMPPGAGSGLAQGSLISIFGTNLGPDPGISAEFPLSNVLAGVAVDIQTAEGSTLSAIPLFVSSGQINALLPSTTPVGMNSLAVRRDGVAGGFATFKVVRSSFGLFASASGAVRTAVAQRFVSETELPLATQQGPARPGDTVVLWGTGLGPVAGPETVAPQAGSIDTPIEVTVGNRSAEVLYQGRAPCCVGLDQINIRIPDDTPVGCYVPLWVSVRGSLYSNLPAIPISADGGLCREHPELPPPLPGAAVGHLLLRRAVDLDDALRPVEATTRDQAVGLFSTPSEVVIPANASARNETSIPFSPGALYSGRAPRSAARGYVPGVLLEWGRSGFPSKSGRRDRAGRARRTNHRPLERKGIPD